MLGLSSPKGQLRNDSLGGGYGAVAKEIDTSGKLESLRGFGQWMVSLEVCCWMDIG